MADDPLKERIDIIEESYEFMLAYAAQGLPGDARSSKGGQLREFLEKADKALGELTDVFRSRISEGKLDPKEHYLAFLEVLERDAESSRAAMKLVLAQKAIGSQLVDNLNASIHVRALLTDLFLLDEAIKSARSAQSSKPS